VARKTSPISGFFGSGKLQLGVIILGHPSVETSKNVENRDTVDIADAIMSKQ